MAKPEHTSADAGLPPSLASALAGTAWPPVPDPAGAILLGLLYQLERTQWLPAEELARLQSLQLDAVLRHAFETVPHYREHWQGLYDPTQPITRGHFSRLPLLTRPLLQSQSHAMLSTRIAPGHGTTGEARTSGSTGMPVRIMKTQFTVTWWKALTLREHLWHRRDFSGTLAAIRQGVTPGRADNWGRATAGLVNTGPAVMLGVNTDVNAQLDWLKAQQPDYLLTYPSNLAELARRAMARNLRLPGLRELRTFGELLPEETRALCREAWDLKVADMYSADEAGYVALQCPEHEHYHVQSEDLLVEVLDDDGQACAPGQTGRVVITTLHNFAMPLVRYELGDFAEVGEPCACGRGLPVLRRIVGRVRNMLVTAAGERFWPALGTRGISQIAPVLQYQLVQKSFTLLEMRLVTAAALTPEQEGKLKKHILSQLPAGLEVNLTYVDHIPRSAGGKFEDFMSEVAQPPI